MLRSCILKLFVIACLNEAQGEIRTDLLGPVHAQFFDLCNGLKCETCLHLVQTKWDEEPVIFFSSSAVFKNVKVQQIYGVVCLQKQVSLLPYLSGLQGFKLFSLHNLSAENRRRRRQRNIATQTLITLSLATEDC